VYPNQIKVVKKSALKATVTSSYFKGDYYLIEVKLNNSSLFLEHTSSLKKEDKVCIEIKGF